MYQKLNKKARGLMLLSEVTCGIVITLILLGVWYAIRNISLPVSPDWIFLLLALGWILSLAAPFVRYERYRYRFTEEEIDVKEGFLFVERNVVPIERLHKVSMVSGPFDRMFGLSKVIVTTAGGDVTIRFLETEVAGQIVEKLKTRINTYAVQGRNREIEKQVQRMKQGGQDGE